MEAKHTPGPWRRGAKADLWIYSEQRLIAKVCPDSTSSGANARLIAAAPELLEVATAYRLHHKLLLNVTDDTDCPCKICQMAEVVIRKAKGE